LYFHPFEVLRSDASHKKPAKRVGRYSGESGHSHQEHRHQKGILAPDQISEAAEKGRAKRADDKSRRKRQKGERESSALVHTGKELL